MGDITEELRAHLIILLLHLLKYDYQIRVLKDSWVQDKVMYTWLPSINNPRIEIEQHINKNPSLEPAVNEVLAEAYSLAKLKAIKELNKYIRSESKRLHKTSFPEQCPWTYKQITDDDWLPGE